jgi:hypothetical protein
MIYGCYYKDIGMHYSINSQIESSYVSDRQCLLCETCFWSATIIRSTQKNAIIINCCPICSNSNISVIPLTNDDACELYVRSNGGLEMKFSRTNKLQV